MAVAVGLVLAMAGSTAVEAQLGGLLKKKAGEVLGGKKAPPADPATPAPGTGTPPSSPGGGDAAAAPGAEKTAVSPLDESVLPFRRSADEVLRGGSGGWAELPSIPAAAVAAAYALDEAAQVALVEKVGAALKALVMSDTFVKEHDAYIKSEYGAANHGLTDVVTLEEAMKKNDFAALREITARQQAATLVEFAETVPAEMLAQDFNQRLAYWKEHAATARGDDRAKYQKLVSLAGPLDGVLQTDEARFRRAYAVLKSIELDGPDTEAAVFAASERVKNEAEQAAWNRHNLKGQLKRQLSSFITIASKVDFEAQTLEKNGKTRFANAAYERQNALWKACFRAGKAPTEAGVALAKAWLAEL